MVNNCYFSVHGPWGLYPQPIESHKGSLPFYRYFFVLAQTIILSLLAFIEEHVGFLNGSIKI